MKIRITKTALNKAQFGQGMQLNASSQPNYNWMNLEEPSLLMPRREVMKPDGSMMATGSVGPAQKLYETSNQGTPANMGPVVPLKKKKINPLQAFGTFSSGMNALGFAAELLDNRSRNREIERAYRENQMNMGPVNYSTNRGDYEINTGMVDPYNTGAKSKGQFANPYYMPMAQEGLSLGPLSFSDNPVRRNVYETAAPVAMNRNVAVSTYVKPPVVQEISPVSKPSMGFKEFIAAKESGGNYKALPKDKSGRLVSSAAGKYQFLWNSHAKDIARVTGVTSKQDFLDSPEAQESYFDYWDTNVLTPKAIQIKQQLRVPASLEEIKAKIHFAGPGGAYRYYATGEETRDAFGTSTSSYKMGGENMNTMKIRISQTPQENMEYGGQLGYGFDLGGRRVYTDMPESTSETVSNTVGPVPREMATIEAEKGETMLSDVDGDGMKEHMKIGGKRHSEGGTPLAAQPGDFIFSDTKRMKIKNPEILAMFGKSMKSGGYTPAQIAKQYDINKYKAILQDPYADGISKRTAERMIDNYEKKLGLLSMVQEAKKGFPQGIPSVAESVMPQAAFGGYLEQYQTKGQVTGPTPLKSRQELQDYIKRGYQRVGNTNVYRKENQSVEFADLIKGTPGSAGATQVTYKKRTPVITDAYRKASPEQRKRMSAAAQKAWEADPANQIVTTTAATTQPKPDTCPDGYVFNAASGKCEKINKEIDEVTYEESFTTPQVPEFTPQGRNIPFGWTQQDINNALLAGLNRAGIKKYSSVRKDFTPDMPDFRNMDWRGRAAELQGSYNNQLNTLGTYQSPTSLAANASFMAGQQAENLINRAIDPIEQANVNIYNQVAAQRSGIMNQARANAAQNQFLRSQDRAVLNQQYDNAVRDANKALTQSINQGITNASGIYNTNMVESPYYYYDPRTQKMKFDSSSARAAFEAAQRSAGPNDGDIMGRYMAVYNQLKGKIAESDLHNAVMEIIGGGKTGRTSSTTYPFNPRMNRTTVQQPFNAYFNPMLSADGMGQ